MAHLQHNLSAQEFGRWQAWMHAERIGPHWDALRHAELLAAVHNGAVTKRDKALFTAADFMPASPWEPAAKRPRMLNPEDEKLAGLFGPEALQ